MNEGMSFYVIWLCRGEEVLTIVTDKGSPRLFVSVSAAIDFYEKNKLVFPEHDKKDIKIATVKLYDAREYWGLDGCRIVVS